jgi:hypothetical protein
MLDRVIKWGKNGKVVIKWTEVKIRKVLDRVIEWGKIGKVVIKWTEVIIRKSGKLSLMLNGWFNIPKIRRVQRLLHFSSSKIVQNRIRGCFISHPQKFSYIDVKKTWNVNTYHMCAQIPSQTSNVMPTSNHNK